MESKEYLEDVALKKSVLPVIIYLVVSVAIFFAIDRVSIGATNFLGGDNVKIINILKTLLIGLLTTFLIFYLVYKFKYVEVNANLNNTTFVHASPYPELLCKLSDYSLVACSGQLLSLLSYNSKDVKTLSLNDILSASSLKILMEVIQDKHYINKDFSELHFVDKSKGLLSLSANVMKLELLDKDYLLLRCHNGKINANAAYEQVESVQTETKKSFQF